MVTLTGVSLLSFKLCSFSEKHHDDIIDINNEFQGNNVCTVDVLVLVYSRTFQTLTLVDGIQFSLLSSCTPSRVITDHMRG